jgi:muramoyltetrapeptide carboxypeptidase
MPLHPLDQAEAVLAAHGLKVRVMPNARNQWHYLAGTDAQRAEDMQSALDDPDIQGILCARGGYGVMRLLRHLNFGPIASQPKVFIGFSDLTALEMALWTQAGLVSFYGPMWVFNLWPQGNFHQPLSHSGLFPLVMGQTTFPYAVPNPDPYQTLRGGQAEGLLLGGNLSLLTAITGTPYQPDTRGKILFIEDWKERHYSLDRRFQQLHLAGWFDDIAGLLLCDFSEIEPEPDCQPPVATEVLVRELVRDLLPAHVPVGWGFGVGHGAQTATLPQGGAARLDADTGLLTLLESPVLQPANVVAAAAR